MTRASLYRHYNASGELLYVGCTCDPVARTARHASFSDWAHDLARIDVQWFPTRSDALKAEAQAIRLEAPKHNCGAGPRRRSGLGKKASGGSDNTALVERIMQHLEKTGETKSAFGKRLANDFGLVRRLQAGHEPRKDTLLRIERALQEKVAA